MSGKTDVKVPEEIKNGWEEIRLCAALLKEGRARIVSGTRKNGSTYRYTKLGYQKVK